MLIREKRGSYDFQISPTVQKSAHDTSHIGSLADSSGSPTIEAMQSDHQANNIIDDDDDGLMLASFHDFDDT